MPQFGQSLSHLDSKTMNNHVLLILVGGKEAGGFNTDCFAHGDDMESRIIKAVFNCAEKVSDAHKRSGALSWVCEAG